MEKLGEPAESYEDFAASLPDDECRYAVYDYDFVTVENCQKSRIFFIAWYIQDAISHLCFLLHSVSLHLLNFNLYIGFKGVLTLQK